MLVAIPGDARPTIMTVLSLRLELHVFIRAGEWKPGDEPEPGLLHARSEAAHRRELPDRREHRLVVYELLEAMQGGLAAFAVELGRLLAKEPVDVRVASVHVGTARHHERLEPGRRVAERGARAEHEVLERLLDLALVVRCALERPKLQAKADGLQIVGHRLGDARVYGVAGEVARVESVGIARLREELLGPRPVERDGWRLPEELEVRRDEAVVHLGVAERLGL